MSDLPTSTPPDGTGRKGSPFFPGIPLEAHHPIFGREDALRFVAGELRQFKSVNLIGERRMGKTSLLNNLIGNQDRHFPADHSDPPLLLLRVDLQDNISKAEQFYGKALRELFDRLPAQADPQAVEVWRKRLRDKPEATAIEFETVLRSLKEAKQVRPVFLIDEFERVFEPHLKAGFPFPDFFDGIRAQITAKRVAMVIFTRDKLIGYFTKQSLTSTFPSYFQPHTLKDLDMESADALLLQPSDYGLTTWQAREARSWARQHPCYLQCAGDAWYQALSTGKSQEWAKERYGEIVEPLGFVNPGHLSVTSPKGALHRFKQPRFWLPVSVVACVGVLAYFHKLHWVKDTATWCKENTVAAIILFISLLIFLGMVSGQQVIRPILDKVLGDGKEEKK